MDLFLIGRCISTYIPQLEFIIFLLCFKYYAINKSELRQCCLCSVLPLCNNVTINVQRAVTTTVFYINIVREANFELI